MSSNEKGKKDIEEAMWGNSIASITFPDDSSIACFDGSAGISGNLGESRHLSTENFRLTIFKTLSCYSLRLKRVVKNINAGYPRRSSVEYGFVAFPSWTQAIVL
jgi:hypothetical protein